MSLTKFGHALTKFDQISVMGEGEGSRHMVVGIMAARLLPLRTENDSYKSAPGSSGENFPGRRC